MFGLSRFMAAIVVFFMLAAMVVFQKEAIACDMIGFSSFEQPQPRLFIDDSISADDLLLLQTSITEGTARIASVYGTPTSTPRFIATNKESYQKWGLNLTAMQSSGIFHECVFIGPKGNNTDVLAHEIAHAELRHRTDFWIEMTQIPAWFIEGTAVKVDYRQPLLLESIQLNAKQIDDIKQVFYFRDFVVSDLSHYQASRVAIEAYEPKKLYQGLARLNQGESFGDVF